MSVLIVVEQVDGEPSAVTGQLVGAGLQLDQTVSLLVVGRGSQEAAGRIAALVGVQTVIWSECTVDSGGVPPEDLAAHLLELAVDYTHILASASTFGGEIMPRLAALLNLHPLTGVVEIVDRQTFVRPSYAGAVRSTLRVGSLPVVMTLHPWAFASAAIDSTQLANIVQGPAVRSLGLSRRLDFCSSVVNGAVNLSTASVVVAGGGGFEQRGNFALVEQLAARLGGGVGASRGAVDAGLASADLQIGQTGRILAPKLYIAIGISGAIQHLAGIKDAGFIVSINRDPHTPMAAVADLALTADL